MIAMRTRCRFAWDSDDERAMHEHPLDGLPRLFRCAVSVLGGDAIQCPLRGQRQRSAQ
jgi:hypothetical protein